MIVVIKLKKKKTAKLKTSDIKDLRKFASLNRFKIVDDKETDDKENQHNELEDFISHAAGRPQNRDRVQSEIIFKNTVISSAIL